MKTYRSARLAAAAGITGLLLTFSAPTIHADPLVVSATVLDACALGTIGNATFATLVPGAPGPAVSTVGTIDWQCTAGTDADIEITDGVNFAAGTRNMIDGSGNLIAYELYQSAGLVNRWGLEPTVNEELAVLGAGMASFTTETVFAEIGLGTYDAAPAGTYTDTVDVTITIVP